MPTSSRSCTFFWRRQFVCQIPFSSFPFQLLPSSPSLLFLSSFAWSSPPALLPLQTSLLQLKLSCNYKKQHTRNFQTSMDKSGTMKFSRHGVISLLSRLCPGANNWAWIILTAVTEEWHGNGHKTFCYYLPPLIMTVKPIGLTCQRGLLTAQAMVCRGNEN